MLLWRISDYPDLEGRGGTLARGRWHGVLRPIVYLADSPASALIEILVHVKERYIPDELQLLGVRIPDRIFVEEVAVGALPPSWRRDVIETRRIGDTWLDAETSAVLRVPSALVPRTWNMLLNPRHASAPAVSIEAIERFELDPRLIGTQAL